MIALVDRIKKASRPDQPPPSTVKDQSKPKTTPAQNVPDLNPETNGADKMSERQNKCICTEHANKPPTPPPSPAGMGAEYDRLWNEAWRLADFIDDPSAAPIEQRRARLPELDRLRARMAAICSNGTDKPAPPAAPDPETSPPGAWHTWESSTATRDRSAETCPARCRRTGKCYAAAYFKGKPGPVKDCEPDGCKYISNERGKA